ncbi:Cell fusion protein aff-1 [Holothuria leucospilota]|uniref:Cell fusion protein aff-1 n=1 Tax=Holothuria leucospilota TaxID=206669 RepID=A0A9Q1CJK3_HOLLE|nr:Cell fusion protein aff-1 [Holothuria leucospilota]
MRSIYLISTIFTIGIFSQVPDCTKEVFITSDISFTSTDSTNLTASIDLTGEISLGETICFYVKPKLKENVFKNYKVEIEGDYNEPYLLVYALNLTQVTRTYSLRDQYTFAKPSMSFYCVCDCPGGSDHCSEDTDYCTRSPGPICENIMVDTLANGCPLSFIARSTTCCSVTVSPSDNLHRYIAYRLGNFETVVDFTLFSFYANNGAFLEPPRPITGFLRANSTTEDDDEPDISVTANNMTVLDIPTSNLYTNESNDVIMLGVEVNAINEWDFNKLGWLRITNSTVSVGDTRRLEDVVRVSVSNCIEDEYFVTAYVSYDKNDARPWGSPLDTTAGDQIISAMYSSLNSSARINYKVSPRMTFDLPLRTPAESFYQSGGSQLQDFSLENSEGGSLVTIKCSGTSGIISGNVQSESESTGYNILYNVSFIVPASLSGEVTIKLTFPTATEPITRVCLHHISNPTTIICRNVAAKLATEIPPLSPKGGPMTNGHMHTPPGNGDPVSGNKDKKNGLRWYHYLFPGQWFNGMDNMIEGLIMTFEIILVVVIAALLYLYLKYRKSQ